ncbi:MAG: hypothetical protein QF837_01270 [Acidimicrobiales bacterium]|nr:hypothetical protein [Acidimicrobiaceae bacterium]MDP6161291.1 hypothetical protein [Acidimicrobiales bacterium]MDP6286173.1 hypothetical protein [Acidimicrobiales bacterium]HJO40265.1 hypothetical protein [Acidimicrobiales bacterium]
MKLSINSKKLTSCVLIFTLLTGCGASLRSPDKAKNDPVDISLKLENEENQTLSANAEKSPDKKVIPLPAYEPLTTEIPEGFCLALAKKSAQLMIEIEKELAAMDTSEAQLLHQLILRSEELVSWVSARVPFVVASKIFELVSFYEELAEALNSVTPTNVTTVRIQGLISASLLSRDSVSLDSFLNASNQLGRYVEDSCGPGYPLLTTFTGLVSNQQLDDFGNSEDVINDFLDIWPKEEVENIDTN